ncbi:Centrosome-associated protein [Trichinella pseudospiralis]
MALDKSIKCLTNDNRKQHVFIGIRWQFQELLVKATCETTAERANLCWSIIQSLLIEFNHYFYYFYEENASYGIAGQKY